jgi:hypothetical protein
MAWFSTRRAAARRSRVGWLQRGLGLACIENVQQYFVLIRVDLQAGGAGDQNQHLRRQEVDAKNRRLGA